MSNSKSNRYDYWASVRREKELTKRRLARRLHGRAQACGYTERERETAAAKEVRR